MHFCESNFWSTLNINRHALQPMFTIKFYAIPLRDNRFAKALCIWSRVCLWFSWFFRIQMHEVEGKKTNQSAAIEEVNPGVLNFEHLRWIHWSASLFDLSTDKNTTYTTVLCREMFMRALRSLWNTGIRERMFNETQNAAILFETAEIQLIREAKWHTHTHTYKCYALPIHRWIELNWRAINRHFICCGSMKTTNSYKPMRDSNKDADLKQRTNELCYDYDFL